MGQVLLHQLDNPDSVRLRPGVAILPEKKACNGQGGEMAVRTMRRGKESSEMFAFAPLSLQSAGYLGWTGVDKTQSPKKHALLQPLRHLYGSTGCNE